MILVLIQFLLPFHFVFAYFSFVLQEHMLNEANKTLKQRVCNTLNWNDMTYNCSFYHHPINQWSCYAVVGRNTSKPSPMESKSTRRRLRAATGSASGRWLLPSPRVWANITNRVHNPLHYLHFIQTLYSFSILLIYFSQNADTRQTQ